MHGRAWILDNNPPLSHYPKLPPTTTTSSPGLHRKAFVRSSCNHILQYADTELLKRASQTFLVPNTLSFLKNKKNQKQILALNLTTEVDVNWIRWTLHDLI